MVSNISDIKAIKEVNREQVIDLLKIALSFEAWSLTNLIDAADKEAWLISMMPLNQTANSFSDKDIKKLNGITDKILQNANKHKFLISSKLQDILEI